MLRSSQIDAETIVSAFAETGVKPVQGSFGFISYSQEFERKNCGCALTALVMKATNKDAADLRTEFRENPIHSSMVHFMTKQLCISTDKGIALMAGWDNTEHCSAYENNAELLRLFNEGRKACVLMGLDYEER